MPRRLAVFAVLAAIVVAVAGVGCTRSFAYSTFQKASDEPPPSLLAQRQALNEPTANARVATLASAPAPAPSRALSSVAGAIFGGGTTGAAAQVAQAVPAAVPAEKEKLVVEAWITLQADDVASAATAVAARVEADGGRVVSSNVVGSGRAASSAALELRVPPGKAAPFTAWLDTLGVIQSRRTLASDVGKLMFDQELALKNLELTMARLQKLVEKDVPIKELLEIEQEMTRVRGEIERVKGEQRWLADRVQLATVTLTIVREGGPIDPSPSARLYAGPRLAVLTLLDPEGRDRTRVGGGVTVHVNRYFTLDLDVFPQRGNGPETESRTVIATLGSGLYSSYLGLGRRRYLNPYLGARIGYGYLGGEGALVIGGELGLELYRHRYVLVEASARAIAFARDGSADAAIHGWLSAGVPF